MARFAGTVQVSWRSNLTQPFEKNRCCVTLSSPSWAWACPGVGQTLLTWQVQNHLSDLGNMYIFYLSNGACFVKNCLASFGEKVRPSEWRPVKSIYNEGKLLPRWVSGAAFRGLHSGRLEAHSVTSRHSGTPSIGLPSGFPAPACSNSPCLPSLSPPAGST